jgi:hypothetical protein
MPKNLNEVLELVKNVLEESGFDNIEVSIQGKSDDNTYMIKVVTKENDEDVNLGLVPVSFDTIGGELAVVLPSDATISQLATKAGLKKYKVAGKMVYASSEEEALRKVATKVKYPYVTLNGNVLRTPEEFFNYFSKVLGKAKKASAESNLDEAEKLLFEIEKEAGSEKVEVTDFETLDKLADTILSKVGEWGMEIEPPKSVREKLREAIELAKSDSTYRRLARRMKEKGGFLPLDLKMSAAIVYDERGNAEFVDYDPDRMYRTRWMDEPKIGEEEKRLIAELEQIISSDKTSSIETHEEDLIGDLIELAQKEDVTGIFSDDTKDIEEVLEGVLGTGRDVKLVASKVVASIKETASQLGIDKEISFTPRKVKREKDTLYIDGEVSVGNNLVTYAAVRADKNGIVVDTPVVDILVKEYNLKKYKLGSVEGYASSEEEFLSKVFDEVEEEVKEANLKPIHIIGNDNDSKVTLWQIKEENGKYYLERLDGQTLIQ